MYNIAICDDCYLELEKAVLLIKNYLDACKKNFTISSFSSAAELLFEVEREHYFDFYFLDILMPDKNGISLAKSIYELQHDANIIFITSSPDFAIQSYEIDAKHYLLKPLSLSKIASAIDRVASLISKKYLDFFIASTEESNIKILQKDIEFIEGKARKLMFHLADKTIITSKYYRGDFESNINSLLTNEYFISPHCSYLVNMSHVKKFNNTNFIMHSEKVIPIVRTRAKKVKELYFDFLVKKRCSNE